ncbi:MAG: MBOAT family protein [Candidatus Sericytochromatia bacterium]
MKGYWPLEPLTLGGIAALLAVIVLASFALSRTRQRLAAWALVFAALVAMDNLTAAAPAGLRMLAICSALLYALKGITGVEARLAGEASLPPLAWFCYGVFWPGMLPSLFATLGAPALPGAGQLMRKGALRLGLGLMLIFAARGAWELSGSYLAVSCLLLPGLSLCLHFGLFNLVAGFWRLFGVPCDSLFQAPLLSRHLSEFWGKRWNLAFTEMTRLTVYQPLLPAWGKPRAALAGFLFSGSLHELAISVPVRAGYGLPISYFVLHGLLLIYERRRYRQGRPIDAHPVLGRIWTVFWLVLPMPVLFHPPFLAGVVWPIVGL